MKNILKILLIMVMVSSFTACGKKEETKPVENNSNDIEDVVDNKTDLTQGNFEFRNIKIESQGAINVIYVTIINKGTKTSDFLAVLYMNNKDGRTLGKVEKQINDLKAGESIDITIEIMGDYTTVNTYKVVIEDLIED